MCFIWMNEKFFAWITKRRLYDKRVDTFMCSQSYKQIAEQNFGDHGSFDEMLKRSNEEVQSL